MDRTRKNLHAVRRKERQFFDPTPLLFGSHRSGIRANGAHPYFHGHMDAKYIDLDYLGRFCDGDRSRMVVFIRMYLQTAPGTFAQLTEKLAEGDAAGLASVAHSLRPQVTHMGAQHLLDRLSALEQQAKTESAAACIGSVDEVMVLSRQVNEELRTYLDKGLSA